MKHALILHGTDGTSQINWFPWLKKELETLNYKTYVPNLPHAERPNLHRYNEFLLKELPFTLNQESILIGHSSGSVAVLGLLQALPENTVVDTCYLVSAFKDDLGWNSLSELFLEPLDFKKIKTKAKKFVFIHSDNDPYCSLEQVRYLHEKLGGELIIQPNQKHFSVGTAGEKYTSFPFLLTLIQNGGLSKVIYEFAKSQQIMSLATFDEHLWIANVYFSINLALQLNFVSTPTREHTQHIAKNSEAAVSIIDSTQTPQKHQSFSKIGIQLHGDAKILSELSEITTALKEWKIVLNIKTDEYFSPEKVLNNSVPEKIYQVIPRKIKFFNETLFDEEEVPWMELQ